MQSLGIGALIGEGLRSKWFSRYGRWTEAEECLARLDYLEREYAGEIKQGC